MDNITLIKFVIALSFVALVAIFYFLRTQKKITIENSDMTIPIIIVFLGLSLFGAIEELDILGVKAKFRNTINKPISSQDFDLANPERLAEIEKGGLEQIEELQRLNPQVMVFYLGRGHYVNSVINQYINRIPSLEFIIVKNNSNEFIALIEVKEYLTLSDQNKGKFIDAINFEEEQFFASTPKIIIQNEALSEKKFKRDALKYFAQSKSEILPVINPNTKEFIGVVRRGVLMSDLLQNIFEKLD